LGEERYDLIVSNPPYVAAGDPYLSQGDLRFEPMIALAGGDDGLDALRAIVATAPRHLTDHGWLALEHAWDQKNAVQALLHGCGFGEVETLRDYAGHERLTYGRWGGF
jgi:release factor glutamine methyltransferase